MSNQRSEQKIDFRTRFRAWWEGFDPDDFQEYLNKNKIASDEVAPAPRPVKTPTPPDTSKGIRDSHQWNEERIEISELVWGPGYCGPGGPELVVNMCKLLNLSPEQSMIIIGAGLGGPSRTLARNFGVWVTGYESSKQLAEAGMDLSTKEGMTKKAPIEYRNFDGALNFERHFERALAKESMYQITEKKAVFEAVWNGLKSDGYFLITDYVLGNEEALESDAVKGWLQCEPSSTSLVTAQSMIKDLEDIGFAIRVDEDISDDFITMISEAWREADQMVQKLVDQGPDTQPLLDTLLREAELWTRRAMLLKSGNIRLWRILASKASLTGLT